MNQILSSANASIIATSFSSFFSLSLCVAVRRFYSLILFSLMYYLRRKCSQKGVTILKRALKMDKSGLMKNLVASSSPGGKLQQVSEEAMEVLKKKIGILKTENSESSQRMAAAEKV
jgi:hypothetical protein